MVAIHVAYTYSLEQCYYPLLVSFHGNSVLGGKYDMGTILEESKLLRTTSSEKGETSDHLSLVRCSSSSDHLLIGKPNIILKVPYPM